MKPSTTSAGQRAEHLVARRLQHDGYKVFAMNWRTRTCEIDIIAFKDECIYIVEVKYRSSLQYGQGLEYVTPSKIRRMHYAAQLWCAKYNWYGAISLCAAQVSKRGNMRLVAITL